MYVNVRGNELIVDCYYVKTVEPGSICNHTSVSLAVEMSPGTSVSGKFTFTGVRGGVRGGESIVK